MDDEKPDTSHLVLKPKVVVPTDGPARPGDGTAISVQLIHRENLLAEEKAAANKRKRLHQPEPAAQETQPLPPVFKQKEITQLDPPAKPGDESAINVPDILRENLIAEERSGWGRLKRWKKRKSRRLRDFLIVVGGTDLALVIGIRLDMVPWLIGISVITLFTSMSAWIVFFVNDDY